MTNCTMCTNQIPRKVDLLLVDPTSGIPRKVHLPLVDPTSGLPTGSYLSVDGEVYKKMLKLATEQAENNSGKTSYVKAKNGN